MPLVFAVLIILVVFFNLRDSKKTHDMRSSAYAKDMRKTNAALEQKIMDTYMKHGLSADEAFRKSYEDMIAAGYEPCIPRDAYGKNSSFCGRGSSFDPRSYDSWLVRDRRKDIESEILSAYPGAAIEEHRDEIDALVYQNFPKSESEFIFDVKRRNNRSFAEPVGTFIIYPGLGTCEVIAHNWLGDGAFGGYYTLKVLRTGELTTSVKIGDSKIQKQG